LQVALMLYRAKKIARPGLAEHTMGTYQGRCDAGVDWGNRLYADALFGKMIEGSIHTSDEEFFDYMLSQRT